MGFLQLIPADQLAALYDPVKATLTLYAQGQVRQFCSGINFYRVPWAGGLKFELQGFVGPVTGKTEPYDHTQTLDIPNLNTTDPSGTAIVVTSNHPNGAVVDIHWTGFGDASSATAGADAKSVAKPAVSATATNAPATPTAAAPAAPPFTTIRTLYVLNPSTFTIHESAQCGSGGSVRIAYQRDFFQLLDSYVQGDDVVWQFGCVKTGLTNIVVNSMINTLGSNAVGHKTVEYRVQGAPLSPERLP